LETLLETSKVVPVSGNVLIDKKKVMELVDQLRLAIPQEYKAAQEVLAQKDQILNQAIVDARRTKARAEDEYRERLDQNEIIEKAQRKAEQTISEAEERAQRLINQSESSARSQVSEADAYSLHSLRNLERQLNSITASVRKGIDMLAQDTVLSTSNGHYKKEE
jgi:cell division septum initiation protein DivIVA